VKIVKEIEMPHEVELPQERPDTEDTKTIDNEEVVMAPEKKQELLNS